MGAPTLIILYLYKGLPEQIANNEPFVPQELALQAPDNYFADSAYGDTYVALAKRWLDKGIFGEVKLVGIGYPPGHARHTPPGILRLGAGLTLYVLPNVAAYPQVHTPQRTDVIFVRGRSPWEPLLEHHPDAFRFYYNGSTRAQWRPRDTLGIDVVLLDDMAFARQSAVPCLEMLKPADETVFFPQQGTRKEYDFCFIGRFDPRDKKGQLAFTRNTVNHRRRGIFVGEFAEPAAVHTVRKAWPRAEIAEHVPKAQINDLLNRSRVSVIYSGSADASPRIVTESLAAGTPVLLHRGNVARKYIRSGAGIATRRLTTEFDLWALLRLPGWRPRRVYDEYFHSHMVADLLWAQLLPHYLEKLARTTGSIG